MTPGDPTPTVDELLDRYIADWHAGGGPSAAAYVALASAEEQAELGALIAGFLELAPTVPLTPEAAESKAADPLVARITALETAHWATASAEAQTIERVASDARPWGARLRSLREAAGLSLIQLAHAFSARFELGTDDASRAPTVFEELEAGALPADGVTVRAARALEQILGGTRGALDGGAPVIGGALLRSDPSQSDDQQSELGALVRHLDEVLPPDDDGPGETLADLLGA